VEEKQKTEGRKIESFTKISEEESELGRHDSTFRNPKGGRHEVKGNSETGG